MQTSAVNCQPSFCWIPAEQKDLIFLFHFFSSSSSAFFLSSCSYEFLHITTETPPCCRPHSHSTAELLCHASQPQEAKLDFLRIPKAVFPWQGANLDLLPIPQPQVPRQGAKLDCLPIPKPVPRRNFPIPSQRSRGALRGARRDQSN